MLLDLRTMTKIRNTLLERTRPDRVPHVMGVEGQVVMLAEKYGADVERCHAAGLLHDLAKGFDHERQEQMIDACQAIPLSDEDRQHPHIWHGFIAAQEAASVFGIDDREILEAVAYHSTGKPGIGTIGQVLYVADFTEPSRNWEGVSEARREIFELDLPRAVHRVAQLKLQRLQAKGRTPHSLTLAMANDLEEKG